MLDKFILRMKIHPMTSSRFHVICRIAVMMNAFLATLYPIAKRKQSVNKMHASLQDYRKRRKDTSTEQVLPLFLNVFLIKRLSISQLTV